MRRFVILAALFWSAAAAADLYRWVDPATGAVKFSSYPPPWYGDETQRRAPKVEHIPARSGPLPQPDAAVAVVPESPDGLPALERERKALLQRIAAGVGNPERAGELQKQLQAFAALSQRLDKLNPDGAAARRTEAEDLLQKVIKGGKP
jgi:hypothetical protein